MAEIVIRLIWFALAATGISYGSYAFIDNALGANSNSALGPIQVMDHLGPGVHQLSGMIFVPSNCHDLSVRVENTAPNVYTLEFQTWEEPSIPCKKDPVPRKFGTTAFAPAVGVRFEAELDGTPVPIVVRPNVVWKKSATSSDLVQSSEE